MTQQDLAKLIDKLALCCANPPAEKVALLLESILDNRLTDDEVRRGYIAVRDSPKPWWPSPGEFLAAARPRVDRALEARSEGERILATILSAPQDYGRYSPHVGRIYDRRMVEARHGAAAGIAFGAVMGRFRAGGFDDDDGLAMQFLRREFLTAYEAARDHEELLPALPPAEGQKSLPEGRTEAERAENRLSAMISGGFRHETTLTEAKGTP